VRISEQKQILERAEEAGYFAKLIDEWYISPYLSGGG